MTARASIHAALAVLLLPACGPSEGHGLRQVDEAAARRDVDGIQEHLTNPAVLVRAHALRTLARMGDERGHQVVEKFIGQAGPRWRREVLVTLMEDRSCCSRGKLRLLLALARDKDAGIQRAALVGFGSQRPLHRELAKVLIAELGKGRPGRPSAARDALLEQGWPVVVPLVSALQEATPVRRRAMGELLIAITGHRPDAPASACRG